MINAMIIDQKDNVAVAIEPIQKGETIAWQQKDKEVTLAAVTDVTIYHKFAIHDIPKGEAVTKYGEHIGVAAMDIRAGEHVHEHNVGSKREDLHD